MLELVYREQGREVVYPIDKDAIVLGRSPKADLSVAEFDVSRFHARIRRQGAELSIQDLGSRNGTLVNGVAVTEARIAPGDRITLGRFELLLRPQAEGAPSPEVAAVEESAEDSAERFTIVRSREDLDQLLARPVAIAAGEGEAARSIRILRVLTQVAKALISEERLEGILRKVMDLVFENLSAGRGVLALYEGDRLVPKVVRHRDHAPSGEAIKLPRAITERVRRDKVSIVTMDAISDERFGTSESIHALGIRSAMCVPLWEKDTVIGIIYVDEDLQTGTYKEHDLDLLTALAGYAAVAIERARLTERIQQELLTRAKLERYHSPGVVEMILTGGGSLEGMSTRECLVSVSFTDIAGFTTLSEGMSPHEVGLTINDLFTELTECVFRFQGTLDKYIGDCVMAVFGAPLAQPDHAVRCVRAALEMHRALERVNAEHPERPPLQLRTGINTGNVVAGDIGSPKRKDYSVLGDTVNLASRLEAHVAKPGQIVIGEATYVAVEDKFECESLGTFTLKGKKHEVQAYRVLGERPGAFADEAASVACDTPAPPRPGAKAGALGVQGAAGGAAAGPPVQDGGRSLRSENLGLLGGSRSCSGSENSIM